jgi:hypothetical protein
MYPIGIALLFACLRVAATAAAGAQSTPLDFTHATVVTPKSLSGPEQAAVAMLIEEAGKRTGVRWNRAESWPDDRTPVIAVGRIGALKEFAGPAASTITALSGAKERKPEAIHMRTVVDRAAPGLLVAGEDSRGVLFAVGMLLRTMELAKGSALLPQPLNIDSAPKYALRGHQLGYRPKTNSYDGWDLPQWEQYIRDLAVFGTNAVELIPPRSDDAADSPHFPRPPLEMMEGMSRLLDKYGLDVWVWYPAMDPDYSDPATVERALAEWGEVFKRLPRIDAVYVPGGDPGHTQPKILFALLEKQAANLHKYHPKAQIWMSPQGFTKEWFAEFLELMKQEPKWLSGIVFGPQVRMPLPELRKAIPKRYPIRHYPDITHNVYCEYPVPDWDPAFCLTELRECVNPRPLDEAAIFRLLQPYTIGFLTYSEGCNDDVNKIVWSGLGWDPDRSVTDILRDYSRYFIGPAYAQSFAEGLLALERNWRGKALTNESIYTTLHQFQALEKRAAPRDRLNWRFQQPLYRAYYDAYVRSKVLYETGLEDEALARLRDARLIGSLPAMAAAESLLDRSAQIGPGRDWRARVFELGEALFQSIRMQLSVPKYQAISVDRGANLDTIDLPLNSRAWLKREFAEIRGLKTEPERLARIDHILRWQDPGPGGFYDAPGDPLRRPHLVPGAPWAEDPAGYHGVASLSDDEAPVSPKWQWTHALTFYGEPLRLRYPDVDPRGRYRVRVVYADGPVRLSVNDRTEIHGLLTKPYQALEFDLPDDAAASGTLELVWRGDENRGGAGRGCQVAEVWLMRR